MRLNIVRSVEKYFLDKGMKDCGVGDIDDNNSLRVQILIF